EGPGVALVPVQERLVGPEPAGLELPRLHPGVGQGGRRRLVHHVRVGLVEVLPELDGAGADDGDLVGEAHAASYFSARYMIRVGFGCSTRRAARKPAPSSRARSSGIVLTPQPTSPSWCWIPASIR